MLVAEGDQGQRRALAGLILAAGHRVLAAASAASALDIAAAWALDLAVVNVFLADATALELIPRLRAFQPGLPVATMTGESSRELELGIRRLGIACYLIKPLRSAELIGLLAHLERRRRRGAKRMNLRA